MGKLVHFKKKHFIHFSVYWLPPILWAGLIFYASSQPYENQDLRPALSSNFNLNFTEELFSDVAFYYAGSEVSIETRGVEGFVEFFIRKGAHLGVYFILGFLVFRLIRTYISQPSKTFFISFFLVVLYAATDELHQYFVPNRTGIIDDVILDSIGGLLGIIVAIFLYKKRNRRLI